MLALYLGLRGQAIKAWHEVPPSNMWEKVGFEEGVFYPPLPRFLKASRILG